jgi:DNA-binding PadR family transcriptional regulator
MTKRAVLEFFAKSFHPVSPGEICRHFGKLRCRGSVYSYLFRLHRQGLLKRGQIGSRLVYSISDRGLERLNYFKSREDPK